MASSTLLGADALDIGPGATGQAVTDMQAYLCRYGWLRLPGQPPVVVNHEELPEAEPGLFDEATRAGLLDFQRFYRLSQTGQLDAGTLALMQRPRCGVPDRPPVPPGERVGNFVAAPTKWSDPHPGYMLSQGTADLSDAQVNDALYVAYRTWCLVAQIAAHAVSSDADIDVKFTTGNHGDGPEWTIFDGAGGRLGHGFFPPPNGGDLAGDLHFDDAETWTRDIPPTGVDLDTVALHEAGHTLGLDHSAKAGAVMYAIHDGPRRELTGDDIEGIRSIYGTRERNPWTNFDAALDGQGPFAGKAYFFRGSRYLRYDWSDDLPDPGYPRSIGDQWNGMPADFADGVDAALNGQAQFARYAYFFKGDQYVRYDWTEDRVDPDYPKPIAGNWGNLPSGFTSGLDTALTGKERFTRYAYFFKGDKYVRYDWMDNSVDDDYPASIAGNWAGLPSRFTSGLQAAMNGQKAYEGKAYFFKDDDYVRYDWAEGTTDLGYPAPIVFLWL